MNCNMTKHHEFFFLFFFIGVIFSLLPLFLFVLFSFIRFVVPCATERAFSAIKYTCDSQLVQYLEMRISFYKPSICSITKPCVTHKNALLGIVDKWKKDFLMGLCARSFLRKFRVPIIKRIDKTKLSL